MSTPYIGQVTLFAGNFAPRGYMFCAGQLLAIAQYNALFALIGTTYGGDGQSTFALPNLEGRVPMHISNTHPIGELSGSETVTLTSGQLPIHNHQFGVPAFSGPGNQTNPVGHVRAEAALGSGLYKGYHTAAGSPTIVGLASPVSTGSVGGNQPHENMSPFLAVNFIIAVEGIFPSRN